MYIRTLDLLESGTGTKCGKHMKAREPWGALAAGRIAGQASQWILKQEKKGMS
jgi:hypothetical protein